MATEIEQHIASIRELPEPQITCMMQWLVSDFQHVFSTAN